MVKQIPARRRETAGLSAFAFQGHPASREQGRAVRNIPLAKEKTERNHRVING
jgi:hypothetical protein